MDAHTTEQALQAIVHTHLRRYPEMRVHDLYKLLFQAAMGCEHAIADPDQALRYLLAEATTLTSNPKDALSMPLSPDGQLVRVGLGPYLAAGGQPEDLADAFVRTSELFRPSIDRLATYWSWTEAMAVRDTLSFELPILEGYIQKQHKQGYPAVHHSAHFRSIYRPAYRVVLRALITLPH